MYESEGNMEDAQAMRTAADQIERLRHRNEVLEAQVRVLETVRIIATGVRPSSGDGFGEDLAWKLRKRADIIVDQHKPVPPPTPIAFAYTIEEAREKLKKLDATPKQPAELKDIIGNKHAAGKPS